MALYFAVSGEAVTSSSLVLVYVVGFIAAVTLGSVAWYNSKRPAGWEDKEKPDFLPTVKPEEGKEG
ncbi:hypothetical protein IQ265_20395 [Nodosilinea sp. LEGE 06152]|uniref:photosystem II assembly protein Psb35 n=1 Tax=Nodosilinea sp. LEGE 06152 TaxID=2777966 RepID=UPI001882BB81|nr:hypothetical protein [Nodosilinea sp. LEGE 06152]MBE9159177.1 hypothetical protein [Nodosilinea sp. LEGE 06152]